MEKKIDELVKRLMKEQGVECSRPTKSSEALKKCVDRDFVHVMFKETHTELGVQLDKGQCKLSDANFEESVGKISLVGGLTLNYNKVKCIAEIDLANCEGVARLEPVSDEEYAEIMKKGVLY
jgi:hypothetical protein